MDRTAARRRPRRLPKKCHCVSGRNGSSRSLWETVPCLFHSSSANSLRKQRNELLSTLPDRRPIARRPRDVETVKAGLAQIHRRALLSALSSATKQFSSHCRERLASITNDNCTRDELC